MQHSVVRRIRVWRIETSEVRWLEPGTIIQLVRNVPNQNARLFIPDEPDGNGSWETNKVELLNSIMPV